MIQWYAVAQTEHVFFNSVDRDRPRASARGLFLFRRKSLSFCFVGNL